MQEVGEFLQSKGDGGLKLWPDDTSDLKAFIEKLTSSDSLVLQQATQEALAYLGYLKRFRRS